MPQKGTPLSYEAFCISYQLPSDDPQSKRWYQTYLQHLDTFNEAMSHLVVADVLDFIKQQSPQDTPSNNNSSNN